MQPRFYFKALVLATVVSFSSVAAVSVAEHATKSSLVLDHHASFDLQQTASLSGFWATEVTAREAWTCPGGAGRTRTSGATFQSCIEDCKKCPSCQGFHYNGADVKEWNPHTCWLQTGVRYSEVLTTVSHRANAWDLFVINKCATYKCPFGSIHKNHASDVLSEEICCESAGYFGTEVRTKPAENCPGGAGRSRASGATFESCVQDCKACPGCQGFHYNAADVEGWNSHTCWLQTEVLYSQPLLEVQYASDKWQLFVMKKCATYSCPHGYINKNYDSMSVSDENCCEEVGFWAEQSAVVSADACPGGARRTRASGATFNSCVADCQHCPSCQGFYYNGADLNGWNPQTCWLKTDIHYSQILKTVTHNVNSWDLFVVKKCAIHHCPPGYVKKNLDSLTLSDDNCCHAAPGLLVENSAEQALHPHLATTAKNGAGEAHPSPAKAHGASKEKGAAKGPGQAGNGTKAHGASNQTGTAKRPCLKNAHGASNQTGVAKGPGEAGNGTKAHGASNQTGVAKGPGEAGNGTKAHGASNQTGVAKGPGEAGTAKTVVKTHPNQVCYNPGLYGLDEFSATDKLTCAEACASDIDCVSFAFRNPANASSESSACAAELNACYMYQLGTNNETCQVGPHPCFTLYEMASVES